MGYERYMQNTDQQQDFESPTDYDDRYRGRSSAREYSATGLYGDRTNRGGYGRGYGAPRGGYGQGYGYGPYGERPDRMSGRSYGRDDYRPRRDQTPADYDYDERGFFTRAGDEVRSWFGDEEAERRRAIDERMDADRYRNDPDYHGWRQRQIAALDRDYDDYRREKEQHFHQQFSGWRQERNTQRQSLSRVEIHMEVLGSDGEHVGTVDKVRGDRIILTKNDSDAGGHHHSIPVRWIDSVDDKVKLTLTAGEAQSRWKDEDRNRALFGESDVQTEPRYGMASAFGHRDY